MVESARRNIEMLLDEGFEDFKVSMKSSDIFMAVEAYRTIAKDIDQPFTWVSRRRVDLPGTVKSAAGLGLY